MALTRLKSCKLSRLCAVRHRVADFQKNPCCRKHVTCWVSVETAPQKSEGTVLPAQQSLQWDTGTVSVGPLRANPVSWAVSSKTVRLAQGEQRLPVVIGEPCQRRQNHCWHQLFSASFARWHCSHNKRRAPDCILATPAWRLVSGQIYAQPVLRQNARFPFRQLCSCFLVPPTLLLCISRLSVLPTVKFTLSLHGHFSVELVALKPI